MRLGLDSSQQRPLPLLLVRELTHLLRGECPASCGWIHLVHLEPLPLPTGIQWVIQGLSHYWLVLTCVKAR
uniref:Uncharacterized protein n=1 Tax=Picea glauca TaxID=3330 RepID=A0A101M0S6_PICGL|nr:hypothetical protein ABT39_MTgene4262 [Picea glauca]QHR90532.1 hypothetical protein Q903MT_gene4557 [Picea sitchensis]